MRIEGYFFYCWKINLPETVILVKFLKDALKDNYLKICGYVKLQVF